MQKYTGEMNTFFKGLKTHRKSLYRYDFPYEYFAYSRDHKSEFSTS